MKKQNITALNMDEILGGGSMKDLINKTNADLFASLKEEKKEICTNKELTAEEEAETSNKKTPKTDDKKPSSNKQQHKSEASCYSFICDKSIKETIQAISRREGWTIRNIMEYALNQFIEEYSRVKPGLRIPKNTSSIENVMNQNKQ